jgi:hypothetical protein
MWPTGYVRRSGQGWKLVLAAFMLFGGGGLVLTAAHGLSETSPLLGFEWVFAGVVAGLGGGLAWPAYSIRCRRCGLKLFWHAIAARSHDEGLLWFLLFDRCPRCNASE